MNEEINFETYLIISYGKFEIFLLDIKNYKNIHHEEFEFKSNSLNIDFFCSFFCINLNSLYILYNNFQPQLVNILYNSSQQILRLLLNRYK